MSMFPVSPTNFREIGAVAHGPTLLAQADGIVVGLRLVIAYSAGLELAVTVVGYGVHAEAMRRQYTAPSIVDAKTGKRRRGEVFGRPMRLRALEDPVLQPVQRSDGQGPLTDAEHYQRDYQYEITGLPDTRHLPLVCEWPEVGLDAVTAHLELPEPDLLRSAIIQFV